MRDIRDVWRELLTAAAGLALYRYWEAVFDPKAPWGWQILTAGILLFFVTFFRFRRGDEEYLSERYAPRADGDSGISGLGQGVDVLSLLVHGGLFTGLALTIPSPEVFLRLYGVLLLFNAGWLWLNLRGAAKRRILLGGEEWVWIAYSPGQEASLLWIRNNTVTTILLLVLELALRSGRIDSSTWLWLGLGLCFLNSFVDLQLAHRIYFPSQPSK